MTQSTNAAFPGIQYVFLDRDGVINRKAPESQYIWQWNQFHLLAKADDAIALLNRAGMRVIVVTNQRGVDRDLYTLDEVDALHARLQEELARAGAHIDGFYVCPHGEGQCDCRKPKTGLLDQAFRDFPTANKDNSLLIGDSHSDVQLAEAFGIPSILIQNDEEQGRPDGTEAEKLASRVSPSLFHAVSTYLLPGVEEKH
ncbi:MAG TPA: HAD family hydrolase [Terracidiphilus sp.]|jgi:D-glycero-D-manno-heptose 1,7-bisphosphate phosphatase